MASQPERTLLTYDDLIQMPEDRNRYEILEGELQVTAAPNIAHQTTVTNLTITLGVHVGERGLGYVFTAPCDVLLSELTVVEPDVLFVSRERRGIILPRHIRGAPDLVVEVLSPATTARDRGPKMQIYERHGVPYYWLLDPHRFEFFAYVLENGAYRLAVHAEGDSTVSAAPFLDLAIEL